MDVTNQHAAQEAVQGMVRGIAQDMDESSRTVPVLVMQVDGNFWSLFRLFWMVLIPVALLVWMATRVLRRYNRELKAREKMYGELEPSPKDEP